MISQGPEAETRLDQALDAPMVLLNDVVEVLDLAQPCEAPQLTVSLHRPDCGRENAQAGAEALLGVGPIRSTAAIRRAGVAIAPGSTARVPFGRSQTRGS
jgi:hypothetical protein